MYTYMARPEEARAAAMAARPGRRQDRLKHCVFLFVSANADLFSASPRVVSFGGRSGWAAHVQGGGHPGVCKLKGEV